MKEISKIIDAKLAILIFAGPPLSLDKPLEKYEGIIKQWMVLKSKVVLKNGNLLLPS